jgi:hypothetical protein
MTAANKDGGCRFLFRFYQSLHLLGANDAFFGNDRLDFLEAAAQEEHIL